MLTQSIVRTLAYFDIFNYPLNQEEVYRHLQTDHVTDEEVARALQNLTEKGTIFQLGEFFSLRDNRELMTRRIAGNKKAEEYMRIAGQRGRWIYQFPFVRGVMISGSLSKNYADDHTDIDFFIITSPGRLWIARTFLVLFKRIFLLNSHKYFCVNYFIDEEHLEIEEKNLFTAVELSTLIPLHGIACYDQLTQHNRWMQKLLPHAPRKTGFPAAPDSHGLLKKILEKIMGSRLGHWMEKRFMKLTQRRWQRHYAQTHSTEDFEIAFKSKGYVSKNHPENFQRQVMERYLKKLAEFGLHHPWKWTHD